MARHRRSTVVAVDVGMQPFHQQRHVSPQFGDRRGVIQAERAIFVGAVLEQDLLDEENRGFLNRNRRTAAQILCCAHRIGITGCDQQ